MLKRIMLCVLLSSSVCMFGESLEEMWLERKHNLLDAMFYCLISCGIGSNEVNNINNERMYANGKYHFWSHALEVGGWATEYAIKKTVSDEPVNCGRYQPTQRQIALCLHAVVSSVAKDEGAKMLVRKTPENLISENVKCNYAFNPKKVATRIVEKGVHEGLYRLICAEVHKNESLKSAHGWFPTGSDDTKAEEFSLQGIGYNFKYFVTRYISSRISGAFIDLAKSACNRSEA